MQHSNLGRSDDGQKLGAGQVVPLLHHAAKDLLHAAANDGHESYDRP